MSSLNRIWGFSKEIHSVENRSLNEEHGYLGLEDLYSYLTYDEKNTVNAINNNLFKKSESKISRVIKDRGTPEFHKANLINVLAFGLSLLEEVNDRTLVKNFHSFLVDYFKSKFGISNINLHSNLYSDMSDLAGKVNRDYKVWDDADLASVILYMALQRIAEREISSKFSDMWTKQRNSEQDNNFGEGCKSKKKVNNEIEEAKEIVFNVSDISKLKLGDKIRLIDSGLKNDIFYYIKTLTPTSIWVTDDESERFDSKASGWAIKIPMGTKISVIQEKNKNVKESLVVPFVGNIVDVMYEALKKWESQGKISNIEKLKKGQLSKEFPQFRNTFSLFDKFESFIFDPKGSDINGSKMVLVSNGDTIHNFAIELNKLNEWNAQNFYKLFSPESGI